MGAAGTKNIDRIAERYRDEELIDLPRILDTKEVSRILGMAQQTVRVMTTSGQLPATRIGNVWRFDRDKIFSLAGISYDMLYDSVLTRELARSKASAAWESARDGKVA